MGHAKLASVESYVPVSGGWGAGLASTLACYFDQVRLLYHVSHKPIMNGYAWLHRLDTQVKKVYTLQSVMSGVH